MEIKNPYALYIIDNFVDEYTRCISCNVQFKNVDMWMHERVDYGPSGHKNWIEKHVCHFCAKTYEKAMGKFMDEDDYRAYLKVEKQIKRLKIDQIK